MVWQSRGNFRVRGFRTAGDDSPSPGGEGWGEGEPFAISSSVKMLTLER
jgi:hypothetical protein